MSAVAFAALAGFISRRPDQWFAPQFWAEDAAIFFSGAVALGGEAIFTPAVGYLHLGPRLIAALASWAPWEYQPAAYALLAGVAAAAVAVRVAFGRMPPLARAVGAAALVAAPHSGEVFLNVTNLNWILGALLAVNLLEPAPVHRAEAARRTAEVALAGLSGPMAVCLAPFVLLWMWRERAVRTAWPVGAAWGVASAIQAWLWLASTRASTAAPEALVEAWWWLLPRYAAAVFVGRLAPYTDALGGVAAGLAAAVFATLLLERANPHRGRALLMLIGAAGLLAAGYIGGGAWGNPHGPGARYTYVPVVLAIWALAWLAAGAQRPGGRIAAAVLLSCALASGLSGWQARPLSQFNWAQQVREARAGQREWLYVAPNWNVKVPQRGVAPGNAEPGRPK